MGKFIEENWFKLIITVFCLIITASISYYFVAEKPRIERIIVEAQNNIEIQKLELRKEEANRKILIEEQERKTREAIDNCLVEAHERYEEEGQNACLGLGYTQEDIDSLKCILPMNQLKRLEDKQTKAQEFCLKAYQ